MPNAQPDIPPARPPRRDAERNRAAIVRAAAEVFTEQGAGAGMTTVARRAGLGPATLYRHFPSKAALVDAVLDRLVENLVAAIGAAVAAGGRRGAFRRLIHAIADVQVGDRVFRELLAWRDRDSTFGHPALVRVATLISDEISRAQAEAALRPDVRLADVTLMLMALDGVSGVTGSLSRGALHRLVDLLVDGLAGEQTPLDSDPLTNEGALTVARDARARAVR